VEVDVILALGLAWGIGALLVLVLMGLLLGPFLIKVNKDGKRQLGPLRMFGKSGRPVGPPTPVGAGDNTPGRVGDPAPGMPEAQADPWSKRAQRGAPPVRS
jgi:hypothetical protein